MLLHEMEATSSSFLPMPSSTVVRIFRRIRWIRVDVSSAAVDIATL